MAVQILLIEDNPDSILMFNTLLRNEDFEIIKAYSGEDGIKICLDKSPDIVVLTNRLLDIESVEISEAIREQSDVPILILAAIGDPSSVARALDAGADDYLIKPVSRKLLVSRINSLVKHSYKIGNILDDQ